MTTDTKDGSVALHGASVEDILKEIRSRYLTFDILQDVDDYDLTEELRDRGYVVMDDHERSEEMNTLDELKNLVDDIYTSKVLKNDQLVEVLTAKLIYALLGKIVPTN